MTEPHTPRRRRRVVALALLAALAVAATAIVLVVANREPSQDEIANNCLPALQARPAGDTSKPDECDGLTRENYTMLLISVGLSDE